MDVNKIACSRMQELIGRLEEADTAYYRDDAPIMSDREYDSLMEELQELEKDMGLVLSGSPTQKVSGEILEELAPVHHTRPMLSAGKTKSVDDVVRFADGRDIVLSWKLDGLTLVLRYENGELKQAVTRGRDGIIGEDVTHTVKTFLNVPLAVPVKRSLEVRGEGVISWNNFKRVNLDLEEPYIHPRNLAAGSVRKLDPGETRKRRLEFFAFNLVSDTRIVSKAKQLQYLSLNGFAVVPHVVLEHAGSQSVREAVSRFIPQSFGYPVDGLIAEYDDTIYGKSLGATGHHENRMIALKWEDELFETRFLGVELAATRTGMVSITGLFEPVVMDGTKVSRAYLHNLDIFRSFQFGTGDTVRVYKANMIIPQIAENATRSGTYQLPESCPCCGKKLVIRETAGGTHQLFCENLQCTSRKVQKFAHFCEKTRMDIEGLSAVTLEKFISHGWVRNFGDLYRLEQHREEMIHTEGFGEKSYERLQASIEKSRRCTLAKFIAGLGIPMVGRHAGRILHQYFKGSWETFEQAVRNRFDFTQLKDFGEIMHRNIYTWYEDAEEEKLWRPLLEQVEFEKEDIEMPNTNENRTNPFYGKTVVATGKLENYTRDEI